MRSPAAVWAVLFLMLAFPFSAAAPNPMPALTLTLSPTSMMVNATAVQVSAVFNGSVQVDKMQQQTVTVCGSISMGYFDGSPRPTLFETEGRP